MTETTESVTTAPASALIRFKVAGTTAAEMGLWTGAMIETAMGQWMVIDSYQVNLIEDDRMITFQRVI